MIEAGKNKRGYELGFSWIFAIIVGAFIIFLAVYAAIKVIDVGRFGRNTEIGKQIGILLNPVETNLESSKVSLISISETTRVYNYCYEEGTFGSQGISIETESSIGSEWPAYPGVINRFNNKYLFSDDADQNGKDFYTEGEKNFYVLSKPLNFPFKVADLIILWSDKEKYCFVNMPNEIDKELGALRQAGGLKNIYNASSLTGCDSESKKVCFSGSCDIMVNARGGTVEHDGRGTVDYVEITYDKASKYSLLYAAIFSEPEIYECQMKRLAKRARELGLVYKDKANGLGSSGLINELDDFIQENEEFISGRGGLGEIYNSGNDLRAENGGAGSGSKIF